MIKEGKWNLDEYVDKMQNEMTNCVKRVVKDIIEKSKGYGRLTKKTWWWNKEVQVTIRLKRQRNTSLPRYRQCCL